MAKVDIEAEGFVLAQCCIYNALVSDSHRNVETAAVSAIMAAAETANLQMSDRQDAAPSPDVLCGEGKMALADKKLDRVQQRNPSEVPNSTLVIDIVDTKNSVFVSSNHRINLGLLNQPLLSNKLISRTKSAILDETRTKFAGRRMLNLATLHFIE